MMIVFNVQRTKRRYSNLLHVSHESALTEMKERGGREPK